jgi:hypothetical protein
VRRFVDQWPQCSVHGCVQSASFPADPGLLLFCGLGAPSAKEYDMAAQIPIGGIHHLRLTAPID